MEKRLGKFGSNCMRNENFWNRKNVFVTGADGFIGSWLTKTLVEKKANVTVLVRDIKSKSCLELLDIKNKVNIVFGDLLKFDILNRIINEYEIESCFHLAAQTIVGIANNDPLSTFESNIRGTWNILEACRASKTIQQVIVASSDKAYGIQEKLPYTEDMSLLGIFPYDASKACADIIARCYHKSFGLNICVTRNANNYGGGDINLNRIIPGTIVSVLRGETPIIRSSGTPERDYMYIEDAMSAYLALAENMYRKEISGEAFNFGTQNPISVIDLFNKIISLCNSSVKPKVLGIATNEIPRQFLDTEKAQRILNWSPKYSLEEGLKKTIQWYKEHFDIFE